MIIKSDIIKKFLNSEFPNWKKTGDVPTGYTYDTLTCLIQNHYNGRYNITKQDVYGVLYAVRNKVNKNEFKNAVVDVEAPNKKRMKKVDVIRDYLNKHYPGWAMKGCVDSPKTYIEIHSDIVKETGRKDIHYSNFSSLLSNTRKRLNELSVGHDTTHRVSDTNTVTNNVVPIGIRQNNNHVIEGIRMNFLGFDAADIKKVIDIGIERLVELKSYEKEIAANG